MPAIYIYNRTSFQVALCLKSWEYTEGTQYKLQTIQGGFMTQLGVGRRPICNLSIIAALTPDGVIGDGSALLWSIPSDLARFKQLTIGRPVIMGRKTWESLPTTFRPLQGRTNIVLTRQEGYEA